MFKLVLEKAEEPEIKCQHPLGHHLETARDSRKNIYFCFIDVLGSVPGRLHRLPRQVIDPMRQVLSTFILGAGPPLSFSALGL